VIKDGFGSRIGLLSKILGILAIGVHFSSGDWSRKFLHKV